MQGDIFTRRTENRLSAFQDEKNFFIQPEQISFAKSQQEPTKHLNDYDFNILKDDAYKDVKDEAFKLEYKINKLELELKEIDSQIQTAESVNNYNIIENLNNRKKHIEIDLNNLKEIYNDTSISAKISGGIASHIKEKTASLRSKIFNFTIMFLSKLPGRFSSFIKLRQSLTSLENINKSVDELIRMKIPYGENLDKYDQLSKYIIKANAIQSDISKVWRK